MIRPLSIVFIVCALGCSAATTSAPPTDAATTDAPGCGATPAGQCYSGSGGSCGDYFVSQVCSGDAWACPPGTMPAAQCRCFGSRPGCSCGPSGWACPDAGTDAGADASADGGRTFACGGVLRCDLATQYCTAFSGGVMSGIRYVCTTLPEACGSAPSCACMGSMSGPEVCRQEPDGSIFITVNAP